MGGLLPLLILFLLSQVAVAAGDSLAEFSDEAIAKPAEVKAYWRATLPNTPMPQAILDMLQDGKSDEEQGSNIHGEDTKMGELLIPYKKDGKSDEEPGSNIHGDDTKIDGKSDEQLGSNIHGDDTMMGELLIPYKKDGKRDEEPGSNIHGDDTKMDKFLIVYKKDGKSDEEPGSNIHGDDTKIGELLIPYKKDVKRDEEPGSNIHGDDTKMDKFLIVYKKGVEHKHVHSHGHNHVGLPKAAEDLFFFENTLASGTTRSTLIPSSTRLNPPFLHHEASKHIPFSPRSITRIIDMFGPASLTMSNDISFTLHQCENSEQAISGEKHGCATSLESYLELIVSTLGTSQVRAFSADVPKDGIASQRYTTASVRLLTPHSQSVLVCHDMEYPYKVFYCHMVPPTRAYQVKLISEADGSSMDALAVCHLNTSSWDPDHPFFKLMHVNPGQTTACHYLSRGTMVWVATAKLGVGDKQVATQ